MTKDKYQLDFSKHQDSSMYDAEMREQKAKKNHIGEIQPRRDGKTGFIQAVGILDFPGIHLDSKEREVI